MAVQGWDVATQAEAIELLRRAVATKNEPEHELYEQPIVDLYAGMMRDFGLEVEVIEGAPGRPSVVGRMRGSGGGRSVFFNGHLNSPSSLLADWKTDPYELTLIDGKLLGMGVSDLKAAIIGMLFAARAIGRRGPRGAVTIGPGAASEQGGLIGTKAIVDRGYRADVAIVGEPTDLEIVNCQRGAVWVNVHVRGRSGLSGGGVNAVHKAVRVAQAYIDLNRGLATRKDPVLGAPGLSVNIIQGGHRISTVPNRCMLTIDRRSIPGETGEEVLAEIERVADELRTEDPELDLTLEPRLSMPPLRSRAEDSLAVKVVSDAVRDVRGREPVIKGIRGFTEMVHLHEVGMDGVVCGPGNVDVIHAPNEYVTVEELMHTIGLYTNVAARVTSMAK